MKLIQVAKQGLYADYILKAENRQDMLELRKLHHDTEEANNAMLHLSMVTFGSEVADDNQESLPIKVTLEIKPK